MTNKHILHRFGKKDTLWHSHTVDFTIWIHEEFQSTEWHKMKPAVFPIGILLTFEVGYLLMLSARYVLSICHISVHVFWEKCLVLAIYFSNRNSHWHNLEFYRNLFFSTQIMHIILSKSFLITINEFLITRKSVEP